MRSFALDYHQCLVVLIWRCLDHLRGRLRYRNYASWRGVRSGTSAPGMNITFLRWKEGLKDSVRR